ncbi:uncharacterized protein DSM5745_02856 [Aspergillus mulundensis]|uniref:Uncharacterized protein n=1 Tax=Aspergillus mulundensis TaxID=1810919 RepID=A0A3D8SJ54_9EURO|nr:hypothetical protein DSM5745_02856 [Aspergillus mulundensis]RDW86214.1 hypothetical protein DSM5745_02856 [Aspergillus mulundensis]
MDSTQPASRSSFEYYNNDFYIVIPPLHRHRRCTISELDDFFNSSTLSSSDTDSVKDRPAHWYRAQLIHYGLRPTDNKGTAAMRLLGALRCGELSVPQHLARLEEDLKREWQRHAREEEKRSKNKSMSEPKLKPMPEDVRTIGVWNRWNAVSEEAKSLYRGVDTPGLGASCAMAGSGTGTKGNLEFSMSDLDINDCFEFKSGGMSKPRQGRAAESADARQMKEPVSRIAAARRVESKTFVAPELELPLEDPMGRIGGLEKNPSCLPTPPQTYPSLPKVALDALNASYKIESEGIDTHDSGLKLRLEKNSVWGAFKLAGVEGVIFMRERPVYVSRANDGGCAFEWRGVDYMESCTYAGPECLGEMRFFERGVEGTFYNVISDSSERFDCDFSGRRISVKNETGAPLDAYDFRGEYFRLGIKL